MKSPSPHNRSLRRTGSALAAGLLGDPERVVTFVSIASPHRGTWMAWLSGAPGVRDMRAGSAFLAAVDADAVRFSSIRWVTIRTPFDLMILPSGNSVLSWAENH